MAQLSDIEISQTTPVGPISAVSAGLGIDPAYIEPYGRSKAKIDLKLLTDLAGRPDGKLILVTAITPTPAGEGKTTTTIGLGDALKRLGQKTVIALREPSLGPVFGIKGGATGGGYAQVVPMEEINLHFTGDIHAVTTANNLIAALLDNHIQQGNELDIDSRQIAWRRCMDMNDRQLRFVTDGLGGRMNGVPREDGFDISVASEVMAVLCLATDLEDLKTRLGRMIVAYNRAGRPVTVSDLKAQGAAAALLKDALKPNLVQTLEKTPALIHGGPFANIAHGCNSVIATRLALKLGDYVVTEAGFGADLGAEKFLDIKCRMNGLSPAAVVIVATARALKYHGGVAKTALAQENLSAIAAGLTNLLKHVTNITQVYGLPAVVALNRFPADTEAELKLIEERCREQGVKAILSEVWEKGGAGGEALADEVVRLADSSQPCRFAYELEAPLREKIETLAARVYGAAGVDFSALAVKQLDNLEALGYGHLPICMAKTQYSLSDDPQKLGAPVNFRISLRSVKPSIGAGFIVALTGEIMTMPGLPKKPAAEQIDVDPAGKILGLF